MKSNKKYRIKSKFRFITFIVVVLCMAVGIFGYVSGIDVSTAVTNHTNDISLEVASGDTLWDIAAEYKSDDTEIRQAVYELCQVNDISSGIIDEGMVLVIPEDL